MGADTKIEWATHTFNPVVGCTKVSPACDGCYAESWAKRTGQPELWNGSRRRTSAENWKQPLKWDAIAASLGERHRVFCASLADVFDNQWEREWRDALWMLIERTPNLDWLLLTKRPQNIAKMLPPFLGPNSAFFYRPWPWPNVWLGTTVENQGELERRVPHLVNVPAVVHFVSAEPLLWPLDFTIWQQEGFAINYLKGFDGAEPPIPRIDWVIAGGESGPKARPMKADWVRVLRDECARVGTAFFFKQWGEHAPNWLNDDDGQKIPGSEWMDRMGKKAAGRLLDGREWNEFPRAA